MTEFDVSAVDLSGVLNTNAEEKAKQQLLQMMLNAKNQPRGE